MAIDSRAPLDLTSAMADVGAEILDEQGVTWDPEYKALSADVAEKMSRGNVAIGSRVYVFTRGGSATAIDPELLAVIPNVDPSKMSVQQSTLSSGSSLVYFVNCSSNAEVVAPFAKFPGIDRSWQVEMIRLTLSLDRRDGKGRPLTASRKRRTLVGLSKTMRVCHGFCFFGLRFKLFALSLFHLDLPPLKLPSKRPTRTR